MINYPRIAEMAFGQPVYATPGLMSSVKAALEPRMLGSQLPGNVHIEPREQQQPEPLSLIDDQERTRQYLQVHGSVAVITVHGILVARRGTIDDACEELISYEWLRNQIGAALADERVGTIVLDLNSGGGMAVGCKELADFIYQARQQKEIVALVNFAAYSACYFIAAACSRIICSPSGGVGSIGTIIEVLDLSEYYKGVGVKFNTFYRGGHKNDGNPSEPITDQATVAINKRLDDAYNDFVNSVASHRGMDVQKVIDTEAGLMNAQEALSLGFIDEIASAQDAIDAIFAAHRAAAPPVNNMPGAHAQAQALVANMNMKARV